MEKQLFTIYGLVTAEGIHDSQQRWNGWACPFFTLEETQRIADAINANNDTRDDTHEDIIIRDGVVFSEFHDGDYHDTEEVPSIVHEGITFYGVGAGSWVWEVVEGEGK